jgi:hypothetical protein
MRSTRYLSWLFLPVALLASCTDPDRLTTPSDAAVPVSDQRSAPPASGPNVIRGLPVGFIIGPDPQSRLVLEAGFDAPFTAINCVDLSLFPLSLTQQQVSTPSGHLHFTTLPQEVSVDVFSIEGGLTDLCQLVDAPVVATGTAIVRVTEAYGADGGSGATTINFTVHGVLELTGGGRARVLGAAHIIIRPDGSLLRDTETITLTPLRDPSARNSVKSTIR